MFARGFARRAPPSPPLAWPSPLKCPTAFGDSSTSPLPFSLGFLFGSRPRAEPVAADAAPSPSLPAARPSAASAAPHDWRALPGAVSGATASHICSSVLQNSVASACLNSEPRLADGRSCTAVGTRSARMRGEAVEWGFPSLCETSTLVRSLSRDPELACAAACSAAGVSPSESSKAPTATAGRCLPRANRSGASENAPGDLPDTVCGQASTHLSDTV